MPLVVKRAGSSLPVSSTPLIIWCVPLTFYPSILTEELLQECRDSEDVYPTIHEFKACSDHADPEETFEDLHWSDLVLAAGQVARRKLRQPDPDPHPTSLLHRGLDKLGDDECARVKYLSGMEYTAAVGVTIMDVMADLNEQLIGNDRAAEVAVEGLTARVTNTEADMDVCFKRFDTVGEDLTDAFHRL